MQGTKEFRCPFEEKGKAEQAIIEVQLGDDKQERLRAMVNAYMQLHSCQEFLAIRFRLPSSVLTDCVKNLDLRPKIICYQAELLAAELDYRLRPLIPYFFTEIWVQHFVDNVVQNDKKRMAAATVLMAKIQELKIRSPRNIVEQSMWIETMFRLGFAQGLRNPAEDMSYGEPGEERIKIITIEPSSLTFHLDREYASDRATNKNCFSIVKTPFYPKAFGRYSEQVEMWVAREADFAGLSSSLRKKVRAQSNTVLREYGIPIKSLEDDVQVLGLWIPPYE